MRWTLNVLKTYVDSILKSIKGDSSQSFSMLKYFGFYPALLAGGCGIILSALAACTNWVQPFGLPDPFARADLQLPRNIAADSRKTDCD